MARCFMLTSALIAAALLHLGAQTDGAGALFAPILRTERASAGVVRIVYDLNGAAGTLFTVSLEVSNDGGQSFAVRAAALTGDIGPGVSAGSQKTIVWDSTKDVDDLQLDRFVFRVVASPATAGAVTALKIVIVGGANAVNDIAQKTVVGPVVEVRDGNDLLVSGARVTFA